MEKARKRAAQSSLIQDLRAQYSEAPVEVRDLPQMSKMEEELHRFEEDNYTRIKLSKKEKLMIKRQDNKNALDSLTKFGDYMAMNNAMEGGKFKKTSRGVKRRGGQGKKKSKKTGKKRRKH
jgi:U3 small nucleolar ribonucleoprotein protein LCP5